MILRPSVSTMRSRPSSAQILLFPIDRETVADERHHGSLGGPSSDVASPTFRVPDIVLERPLAFCEAVISGTFRKDPAGLRLAYQELLDLGCKVLSPRNAHVVGEQDGFVYMAGEQTETPEAIELQHLEAMERAQFVWLFAPEGYVGLSAALEVGFARAAGIPVYSTNSPSDAIVRSLVRVVSSPREVASELKSGSVPVPQPALQAFQSYYKRVAVQRGYQREDARDCLLLMVEEIGELARAIRKREGIKRHGKKISEEERSELADVFMYVIHMANILGLNLSEAVRDKELRNLQRVARALK